MTIMNAAAHRASRAAVIAAACALVIAGCAADLDPPGDPGIPEDPGIPDDPGPDPDPDPQPGDEPDGDATVVQVLGFEFGFDMSADEFEAGAHTFVFINGGSMEHDLTITGPGVDAQTPIIDPGQTAELTVTLEPGTYEIWCSVSNHRGQGMLVAIEVV